MRDELSLTFSALADPTRRALLARLADGASHVSDLAEPFLGDMSLPAITKHLKVLEQAGLIQKTKSAQWRTCSLRPAALKDASGWIEQYRELWEEQLDRLGDYLKDIQTQAPSTERKGKNHGRKTK